MARISAVNTGQLEGWGSADTRGVDLAGPPAGTEDTDPQGTL